MAEGMLPGGSSMEGPLFREASSTPTGLALPLEYPHLLLWWGAAENGSEEYSDSQLLRRNLQPHSQSQLSFALLSVLLLSPEPSTSIVAITFALFDDVCIRPIAVLLGDVLSLLSLTSMLLLFPLLYSPPLPPPPQQQQPQPPP